MLRYQKLGNTKTLGLPILPISTKKKLKHEASKTALWLVCRKPVHTISYVWIIKQRLFVALDQDYTLCVVGQQTLFKTIGAGLGLIASATGILAGLQTLNTEFANQLALKDQISAVKVSKLLQLQSNDLQGHNLISKYSKAVQALTIQPNNQNLQAGVATAFVDLQNHVSTKYNLNCEKFEGNSNCSLSLQQMVKNMEKAQG